MGIVLSTGQYLKQRVANDIEYMWMEIDDDPSENINENFANRLDLIVGAPKGKKDYYSTPPY